MFEAEYNRRKTYIDSIVRQRIDELVCPSPVLLSAIKYSVSTGGKRLRAILAQAFFQAFATKDKQTSETRSLECVLAAIEILHLYTLVHDDLPCMDNDDFRRGVPSNHKVFGQSMALLCGDALLNYAYETLFLGATLASNKAAYIKACSIFATLVGSGGLIGGQALEFESEREKTQQSTLEIYKHKTCDLICASAVLGAILADASDEVCSKVNSFGYHFGIAFQIKDDLLDIDEKGEAEKNSLVGLIGEQNANNILEQNIEAALKLLKELKIEDEFLYSLTNFAAKRTI